MGRLTFKGCRGLGRHGRPSVRTMPPSGRAWMMALSRAAFRRRPIEGVAGPAFTERYNPTAVDLYGGRLTLARPLVGTGARCDDHDGDASGAGDRVARVAPNCYEFYFVSRTEDAAPGPPDGIPRWTARGAECKAVEPARTNPASSLRSGR